MSQVSTLMWEQHRGRWHKSLSVQEKKSAKSLSPLKGCVILGRESDTSTPSILVALDHRMNSSFCLWKCVARAGLDPPGTPDKGYHA